MTRMPMIRPLLTVLGALAFLGGAVVAAPMSDWIVDGAARLRLVAGAPAADGSLRAGLEIRLDPGWKTYWLNPGPTGLPPKLALAGTNLASAEPLWPTPSRFDDGGTSSVGYSGILVVPLRIVPKDAARPVTLTAVLDYGLCEKICVPAHAELALDLVPGEKPDLMAASQLKAFEARLPKLARLGGKEPLAVTGAARTKAGLGIEMRFPEGAKMRDLFARSPGATVGVPRRLEDGSFRITLKSGPYPKTVELIAVADSEAISVPLTLDDLPLKP